MKKYAGGTYVFNIKENQAPLPGAEKRSGLVKRLSGIIWIG